MVEMIEFSQGVLCVSIHSGATPVTAKGQRRIEFDFRKGGTITEVHCRELMDFVQTFYPKRAGQISQLIFELLDAHTRVGRINLDLFASACERHQLRRTPDVLIEFFSRAVEGARSDEQIALTFRKCDLD